MSKEENRYSGPKLFPDSREVIYDTPIAELDQGAQKVYLEGGYHSLVNQFMSVDCFVSKLNAEEQVFLRNRLARELVDCTAGAHSDKEAVRVLLKYFDLRSDKNLFLHLAVRARSLAETYVHEEKNAINLVEKPSI